MTVSFLIALAMSLMSGVDDPRPELDRLQGAWRVVYLVSDGQPSPEAEKARWVFTGRELAVEVRGRRKLYGTIEVEPAGSPKPIDGKFTVAVGGDLVGFTELGIYRLDDDALRICLGGILEARPAEFVSNPGSKSTLVVLKREKP